jgi:glutamine synthetase
MHINMSLSKDGVNLFQDDRDPCGLSREAYYFLGGLMKHMKAMTLILNPVVNSYKRLVPGYEAPAYMVWSARNRTPLVRIPATRGKDTRIELRSPDPSCNPYLAIAVCLAAGLDGIRNQIDPPDSMDMNMNALSAQERKKLGIERLPENLKEAVDEFEKDPFMREVLGEEVCRKYAEAKRREWEAYNRQISEWELRNYLLRI